MSIKQIVLRTFVLGAIAASATFAAKAETLDFAITGPGTDITFALSSTPTVSLSNSSGYFELDNVVLDINGSYVTDNLFFFTSALDGGIASDKFDLFGPQLFTGTLHHPKFKKGDFTLSSSLSSTPYCDQGDYQLSIEDPPTVTPEPSSMILLATGLLTLVGAGAAKRFAA